MYVIHNLYLKKLNDLNHWCSMVMFELRCIKGISYLYNNNSLILFRMKRTPASSSYFVDKGWAWLILVGKWLILSLLLLCIMYCVDHDKYNIHWYIEPGSSLILMTYVSTRNSQSNDNEIYLHHRYVIVSHLEDSVIKLQYAVIFM